MQELVEVTARPTKFLHVCDVAVDVVFDVVVDVVVDVVDVVVVDVFVGVVVDVDVVDVVDVVFDVVVVAPQAGVERGRQKSEGQQRPLQTHLLFPLQVLL